MKFEHRTQKLLPFNRFLLRVLEALGIALGLTLAFLVVGTFGYRYLVGLEWLDAVLNAAMILSGMGPVDEISTESGKVFASAYAIMSGFVFAISTGIIISPILHRVFHRLHLEKAKN
jgi:FtsH-binding integral membrane protein